MDKLRTTMGIVFGAIVIIMILYVYILPQPWSETFIDLGGCGPGRGVCPEGLRCINGYCKTDVAPVLPALSDLPVRPDRY
jgi:hypothetical protein